MLKIACSSNKLAHSDKSYQVWKTRHCITFPHSLFGCVHSPLAVVTIASERAGRVCSTVLNVLAVALEDNAWSFKFPLHKFTALYLLWHVRAWEPQDRSKWGKGIWSLFIITNPVPVKPTWRPIMEQVCWYPLAHYLSAQSKYEHPLEHMVTISTTVATKPQC